MAPGKRASGTRGHVISSGSEKPRSVRGPERTLDLLELARRLLPALTPEHRAVVDAIYFRELSQEQAAAERGISRTTLSSRLMAARKHLAAMAALFLPESQRGPS